VTIDKVLIIASAFVKNKQGKILLLKRSEKSSYPGYWQLVEGKLEDDELPIEAIRREVGEELGAKILQIEFSDIFFNEIEAKSTKYLCFRTVFNVSISFEKLTISDEHVTFGWFDKSDIKNLSLLPGTEKVLEGKI
jgi:8-oxo-dGTP pyrophosphatase MutT (NUDIX family)